LGGGGLRNERVFSLRKVGGIEKEGLFGVIKDWLRREKKNWSGFRKNKGGRRGFGKITFHAGFSLRQRGGMQGEAFQKNFKRSPFRGGVRRQEGGTIAMTLNGVDTRGKGGGKNRKDLQTDGFKAILPIF